MPDTIPTDPKVDAFLSKATAWRPEMEALRALALECGLVEALKWGQPCYTSQGKNVVIIGPFKEYCALMFFKGALLKDRKRLLVQPGQVQAGRQIRFTHARDVVRMKSTLMAYIREAIEVETAGRTVKLKQTKDFAMPQELRDRLKASPALQAAFKALTPGRQRGYLFYFSAAKQSKTRQDRIEKCAPLILKGKGFNED